LAVFIVLFNLLIYIRASETIENIGLVFGECARNSGRISAVLNLVILFLIGYFGLKTIYKIKTKTYLFQVLIILFGVNHLIHFIFVSYYFKSS